MARVAAGRFRLFTPIWLRLRWCGCGVSMRVGARMLASTDSPWLSERRAQRKASSTAHPATAPTQVCGLLGSDTHFTAVRSTAPSGRATGSVNWGSDPKNPSQTVGRLFFAYFLLARQKKVSWPPGRNPAPALCPGTPLNQCPSFDRLVWFGLHQPNFKKGRGAGMEGHRQASAVALDPTDRLTESLPHPCAERR